MNFFRKSVIFFLVLLMPAGWICATEMRFAEMPEGARALYGQLKESPGLQGNWGPILNKASLSPEDAFWLAAARAAANGGQPEDAVFDTLSDLADWMGKETLLKKLLRQTDNPALMQRYARKFPDWIQPMGEALIAELERDFNLEKLLQVAGCLKEHPNYWVEVGKLDAIWKDHLKIRPKDASGLIQSAAQIGISPETLWRELIERDALFANEKALAAYGVQDNLLYILKQGDDAVKEKVREAIASRRGSEGLRLLRSHLLIEQLWKQYPEIFADPFLTPLELLYDHLIEQDAAGFSETFFDGKVGALSTPVFFHKHRERILEEFQSGEQRLLLYPLLCKMVMEIPVIEIDSLWIQTEIEKAFAIKDLSDRARFHIAFAGLLTGMNAESLREAFVRGLISHDLNDEVAGRYSILLNESHAQLLPALLAAMDGGENQGKILRTACMIAPTDSDLNRQLMQVIFEGGDTELACELVALLGLFDRAPPLSAYPEGRLQALATVETREAYDAFQEFLSSYDGADLEELLPIVLSHLSTYASQGANPGLGVLFETSEKNQRAAVKPLLDMLNSADEDHIDFACKTLSVFSVFTEEELGQIGEALHRFGGLPERNPLLFSALSRMGPEASILEEQVKALAVKFENRNRLDARGCLASISADPETRRSYLSGLITDYKMYWERIHLDSVRTIQAIGNVRGQEEDVIRLLEKLFAGELRFTPESAEIDAALAALETRPATEELMRLCRGLLRKYTTDPGERNKVGILLKLVDHQYSDRLPSFSEEIESMPLRLRNTFLYRGIFESLQRGWKEPQPAPLKEGPVRLAVLGVGKSNQLQDALIPLLEARLSEGTGTVLLEREAMHTLMREQALTLTGEGGVKGTQIVRAGRVMGVDLFCLIETTPKGMRVQLIDSWQGLKLWDRTLEVSTVEQVEKTSVEWASRIQNAMHASRRTPGENLLKLGVLDFRSVEPGKELDGMTLSVRDALEQQLSFLPGVEVLERRQMQPLLEERVFSPELPEAMESVMLLLDGEFHLDAENADLLVVRVRARRNEKEIFTCQAKGPRDDLRELGSQVVARVREQLDDVEEISRMWPELESEILLKQARTARDPELKLGAVAAAKALLPDDPLVNEAYLREIQRQNWAIPLPLSKFPWYLEENRLVFERQLAARQAGTAPRNQSLPMHLSCSLHVWSQYQDVPEDQKKGITALLLEMFNQYWAQLRQEQGQNKDWNLRESLRDVPEYFAKIGVQDPSLYEQLYKELVYFEDFRLLLQMTEGLEWPSRLSAEEQFAESERFYTWLRDSHESIFLRMSGMRGLARLYAERGKPGDEQQTRMLYEVFEKYFMETYLPTLGPGIPLTWSDRPQLSVWISSLLEERAFGRGQRPARYFADREENLNYRVDHILKLMRQLHNKRDYPEHVDWLNYGYITAIEKSGRIGELKEMLESALRYYNRTYWRGKYGSADGKRLRRMKATTEERLRELKRKHPEFADPVSKHPEPVPTPDPRHLSKPVLGTAEIGKWVEGAGKYHFLVVQHGFTAVITDKGLLYLKLDTFKPLRFEPAPERMDMDGFYAVDGSGIYTVSTHAIIWFPPNGPSRMYFKNHPDLKLLREDGFSVDVLERKIYLATPRKLLEFDLEKGSREILLSTTEKIQGHKLNNVQRIGAAIADINTQKLQIAFDSRMDGKYQSRVVVFSPGERTFTEIQKPEKSLFPFVPDRGSRRVGRLVLNMGQDTASVSIIGEEPGNGFQVKWDKNVFRTCHNITLADKGFVNVSPGPYYFKRQDRHGKYLWREIVPPSENDRFRLQDVACHPERGLLLLSTEGIHAVPGMRSVHADRLREWIHPEHAQMLP
ncbi:hypothetical protein P0Y35_05090 [Kiritimatiellaeota bacterium B1221]|nr:hypothetical protein [Kiritimatiellaeota bacterium B1221]